jgi:hypothetical protein
MAYDPVRRRVLLFGGYATTSTYTLADTWEWDGTDWNQLNPARSPPGRSSHAMAYDAARARVVLFGGQNAWGPSHMWEDTWEWDGTTWSERATPIRPAARRDHTMAYDSTRGRVVLFGGNTETSGFVIADTWEWDGTSWSKITTASAPEARYVHAMTYDAARRRTVLHGGGTFYVILGDTWVYHDAAASFARFGAGCAGSAGTPLLEANGQRPWMGESFTLFLSNLPPGRSTLIWLGRSNTRLGPTTLPLDLTPLGMTGCSLLVSPEHYFPVFNFSGAARWTLAIPRDPSLLGETFFNQALVVDPSANPFGAIVSNGGQGVFGRR